jgi:hemerythrin
VPYIEWTPRYATGIGAIDAQHHNLVDAIRRLQEALERGLPQAAAMELAGFLLRYVDEHFRDEEAFMERIGLPGLRDHRLIHERPRARAVAIAERVSGEASGSAEELSLLLFEWLRDHILHDDFSYAAFARQRGGEGA